MMLDITLKLVLVIIAMILCFYMILFYPWKKNLESECEAAVGKIKNLISYCGTKPDLAELKEEQVEGWYKIWFEKGAEFHFLNQCLIELYNAVDKRESELSEEIVLGTA